MPYPPRIAILPSPFGSHAKPMRGAGLKRCPVKQPALLLAPTVAFGNCVRIGPGIEPVPPLPPHCTMPLKGLPPVSEPFNGLPGFVGSLKIAGCAAAENALGWKLNAL